jgi:hypothetical protein
MSTTPEFKPTITVSPTVRQALYALTAVGSLIVTYLGAKNFIGAAELAMWTGWTVLVMSLAVSKTDTRRPVKSKTSPSTPTPPAAPPVAAPQASDPAQHIDPPASPPIAPTTAPPVA